jgi:glucose-1-phosphate cytidylyltransferase
MGTQPTTVILCGGRGTRAYPHTVDVPKPLLHVADRPVLLHVMEIYADQGFTDFVLAAGYRGDMIREFASGLPDAWNVVVVDTGEETNKGDRVLRVREHLTPTFFVTYSDGLGDVDLRGLLDFHNAHEGSASVTVVPLPSQYGTLDVDNTGRVRDFLEKPRLFDHWINAGFLAMDDMVFDGWRGDLETEVMPMLADAGLLFAHKHEGFWKSMDTFKEALDLTDLCREGERSERGRPPWLRSATRASS